MQTNLYFHLVDEKKVVVVGVLANESEEFQEDEACEGAIVWCLLVASVI